ncbi:unnamed protein product [Rhizoctonia solani]|uniref:Uncharacterized protein n=1 Tax=Rhizoctonia solani TaxID=456999 RepID=A0A8H3BVC2_9AGAM|nr:unnamed protein product [Rhizoctonia solani]
MILNILLPSIRLERFLRSRTRMGLLSTSLGPSAAILLRNMGRTRRSSLEPAISRRMRLLNKQPVLNIQCSIHRLQL